MNIKEKVVFVGLDASKATLAVSVADDGRNGEIRDGGKFLRPLLLSRGFSRNWLRVSIALKSAMRRGQPGMGCIARSQHLVSPAM